MPWHRHLLPAPSNWSHNAATLPQNLVMILLGYIWTLWWGLHKITANIENLQCLVNQHEKWIVEKGHLKLYFISPKCRSPKLVIWICVLQQTLSASQNQLLLSENCSRLPLLWTLTQACYPLVDKSAWVSLVNLVQRDLDHASANLIMIL